LTDNQSDNYALETALDRALDLWYTDRSGFQQLQRQGMACDYSWNIPGEQYIKLYDSIRHR
ncbi:MAG: starch synthase, partial [Cyanobacteria bacterium J06607_17]